jgi:hypothetical protein
LDGRIGWLRNCEVKAVPRKDEYNATDIHELFKGNFEEWFLCARLFLALSQDKMKEKLRSAAGDGGIGANRYSADPDGFVAALESLGLLTAMETTINYEPVWSDILTERLRSGRGSAIQGQKRGRGLEDLLKGSCVKSSAKPVMRRVARLLVPTGSPQNAILRSRIGSGPAL